MQFLAEYGLFLAKTITFVIAILITVIGIVAISMKNKDKSTGVSIKKINDDFEELTDTLQQTLLGNKNYKKLIKSKKSEKKKSKQEARPRLFVIDFKGDIKASKVTSLRQEIDAVLMVIQENDEVLVKIESPGGVVPAYGLAASQLARFKQNNVRLITAVDKVAASGGYLMASVADKILAAPFAMIGSIGVVMQLPNFNRLLKKHDVDFEMLTAGKYKRTLTVFGENDDEARNKAKDDVEEIHKLFKGFLLEHRELDIDKVATGEVWLAAKAKEFNLVDELTTSDEYILEKVKDNDVFVIKHKAKKSVANKLCSGAAAIVNSVIDTVSDRLV